MYIKICKNCKKEFEANNVRKIFCSGRCRDKDFRSKHRYSHICLYCKKSFISKLKKTKYCSITCASLEKNEKGTGKNIHCPICDEIFKQRHNKHIYCSSNCREKANRDKYKINVSCSNCGIIIKRLKWLSQNNFFCSVKCQSEFVKTKSNDIRKCENCGNDFVCRKSEKLRFCSTKCQGEWQRTNRIGKNSSNYNHNVADEERRKNCEYCGKEIIGTPSEMRTKRFCSIKCMLMGSKYSMTTPHKIACKILDKHKVNYSIEENIKRYSFDCFMKKENFAIEIMGGFYHCDPRYYNKPINEIQKNSIKRDKNKKELSSNKNIKILYLWEDDLMKEEELCEKLILKFIKKNGILKNYHSMNYSIVKNKLILNDKILIPQFEKIRK